MEIAGVPLQLEVSGNSYLFSFLSRPKLCNFIKIILFIMHHVSDGQAIGGKEGWLVSQRIEFLTSPSNSGQRKLVFCIFVFISKKSAIIKIRVGKSPLHCSDSRSKLVCRMARWLYICCILCEITFRAYKVPVSLDVKGLNCTII